MGDSIINGSCLIDKDMVFAVGWGGSVLKMGGDFISGVEWSATTLKDYYLKQNYPNPFNPSTTIRYELPKNSFVNLKVYNILGKEIETLVNENQTTGVYRVNLNASNYPSGIYFCRIQAGDFSKLMKMVLIK